MQIYSTKVKLHFHKIGQHTSGILYHVEAGFRPPLQRVGCCALGLRQYTETNSLIDGNRRFIVLDQGMVP